MTRSCQNEESASPKVQPFLQAVFFLLVVKPLTIILLGINLRRADLLPSGGPAVIVANHNSHLDTLVLMSLFPLRKLHLLRPVAAADYFLTNRLLKWFALRIIGIIPLSRKGGSLRRDPLQPCKAALDRGEVLILFPEGTRGEPEKIANFKPGVAHIARDNPDIPVIPVYMQGLGKALPRGEALFVPCICDINVGKAIEWCGDKPGFMQSLQKGFDELRAEINFPIDKEETGP